jgi:transposase
MGVGRHGKRIGDMPVGIGRPCAGRDAICEDPVTSGMMDCLLRARDALGTEYLVLNKLVVQIAMRDELCRRLMAIPGVGPVTALSFRRPSMIPGAATPHAMWRPTSG